MELEKDKGVTYFGVETYEKPVTINSGARGIVKEINVNNCVVVFPTIMGWHSFTLDKDDLVANGLSSDQTWKYLFPGDD